ncbi:hypothetical protein [Alicyclobacillus fastidiosus]|uniref:hypothetical protein n=1 Tax=Alicyclobacillus fastidiosus TaxID=392011 RepID=UPI0024E133E1|nr:hypothetical protein [Alicyclobacillus fastidiosus]
MQRFLLYIKAKILGLAEGRSDPVNFSIDEHSGKLDERYTTISVCIQTSCRQVHGSKTLSSSW